MSKTLLLAILFSFISVSTNGAEGRGEFKVCAPDAKKLCPGLKIRKGLGKCMMDHRAELSPDCQAVLDKKTEELKSAITDCREDVEKLCKKMGEGKRQGSGQIALCLKKNVSKLTPACKVHVEKK